MFVHLSCAAADRINANPYTDPWGSDMESQWNSAVTLFITFAVLMVVFAIIWQVYRVSAARKLAEKSGLDPKDATRLELLGERGLEATYLAANLKASSSPQAVAGDVSVAERLRLLKELCDQGLITQEEHDKRHQAIIDSL